MAMPGFLRAHAYARLTSVGQEGERCARPLERGTEMVGDRTTGVIWDSKFYFMANTDIESLDDERIVDLAKLGPIANCGLIVDVKHWSRRFFSGQPI